ncbi:MAG TPA: hypothetical protein VE173_10900, partial [Longimicrobiales bacterium]|nr:hypothetical protein [Longimicrobiales bacterium]
MAMARWGGQVERTANRRRRAGAGVAGFALAGLFLTIVPDAGSCQVLPPPDIALLGGISFYDLDVQGSGTTPFGGLRFRLPMSRHVLVEPGVTFARPTADSVDPGADRVLRLLILEFQAQVQLPLGRFHPYGGVGAGGVLDFRGDRGSDDFLATTYSL